MNYVFDVDGTLTPSRGVMIPEFKEWFLKFCQSHNVYLVTGSDHVKTLEQVGPDICSAVKAVYNCAGNAVYVDSKLISMNLFEVTQELKEFLEEILAKHKYPVRTGNHIEERVGSCNFSIVGRNANKQQRADYHSYSISTNDRRWIASTINAKFLNLEATIGGETGVDIYARGKDKSQIANTVSPFVFFGDAIYIGGNDYTIAAKAEKYHYVKNWEETFEILKTYE